MNNKKFGIRAYVIWLTLAPLLLMSICFEAFSLHDRFADMERGLLVRGHLIASQMASSSEYGVFSNNHAFLNSIAAGVLRQPDVSAVVVLNAKSRILVAAGDVSGIIKVDAGVPDSAKPVSALVNSKIPVLDQGDMLLLYQPIVSEQIAIGEIEEAEANVQQLGSVIIKMSWQQTRKLEARLLWITVLTTALFLLVTLTLVHHAGRYITGPISKLCAAIHDISNGDLETRVDAQSSIEELATLANGINQMKVDLQHERNVLQSRIDDATRQLRQLAFYDTLTSLPNRRLLLDRLSQTLVANKRSGRYGALMFIDLDNFKPINDEFGHSVGDLLLIEVALRIRGCLREMDTVSRFGGDEFVGILTELSADHAGSVRQAAIVAEKIRVALAENYYLSRLQDDQSQKPLLCHCTSSIGVALFTDNDVDQDELMKRADLAMYQAKQDGRNLVRFFNPGMTIPPESAS
jgi:diguanylate cyclase (GGDEF)-like protein